MNRDWPFLGFCMFAGGMFFGYLATGNLVGLAALIVVAIVVLVAVVRKPVNPPLDGEWVDRKIREINKQMREDGILPPRDTKGE